MRTSLVLAVSFVLSTTAPAPAQRSGADVAGSEDHRLLSRYQGCVIEYRKHVDHGEYVLGIGVPEQRNVRGHGRYFAEYLDLEGTITRLQYTCPIEEGLVKMHGNYRTALEGSGFEVLFELSDREFGDWPFWNEDVYWSDGGNGINQLASGAVKPSPRDGWRYLAARGSVAGTAVYVSLFMNLEGAGSDDGYILVTQDIIEVDPMETGLVTAELIDKGMRLEGRVAVYGILFETGKSEIQAESRPALDEMAAYIAANPETRFFIVGHTDATGSFDGNLELSRHRAAAVVRALVSEHAVPAERLTAHGVGPLCPVAPNTDASGRARNRRVEIVER